MKKIKLILFLAILSITTTFSQSILNNGSDIYISNGTTLTFTEDYINLGDGTFMNDGNVDVLGSWVNNGTNGVNSLGYYGFVNFKGNLPQTISGSSSTEFNGLQLEQDVKMFSDITVWDQLNLNGGSINLKNNELHFQGWNGINSTSDYYCIAEGVGKLKMFIDMMTPSVFPVGTSTSYTPLTISINSASDTYGVNVIGDVLSNGNSGTTIPEIDDCVNLTWNVEAEYSSWVDYNIEVQWNDTDEGVNFNRNFSAIGDYHTANWNGNTATIASGANPYNQTLNNIDHVGSFAVGDTDSPMAITLNLMVDITALLEGPYNGYEMETLLNDDGHLPLSQPYNETYWNYNGTESVAAIPNTSIVDWVLVELRDATDAASALPSTIIERQAAFVMVDGSIVGLDGINDLQFTNSPTQNLFVVVYHRNHLNVMSAVPLTESSGVYVYNFTTGANQAYADGQDGQKEIATGIWGMYGGDGANGGHITDFDKDNIWKPEAGKKGYSKADYNLNGQVENIDKNDVWVGNYLKSSQVPE